MAEIGHDLVTMVSGPMQCELYYKILPATAMSKCHLECFLSMKMASCLENY